MRRGETGHNGAGAKTGGEEDERSKAPVSPDWIEVTVECTLGQEVRTRIDRGVPEVVRPLPAGIRYPANYGYVEGTQAADGEAIDVFLVSEPLEPLSRVPARVVAAIEFWDARGEDEKLVAVPLGWADVPKGPMTDASATNRARTGRSDDPPASLARTLREIQRFLADYKPPEAPHRVGRLLGPRSALGLLRRARRQFGRGESARGGDRE